MASKKFSKQGEGNATFNKRPSSIVLNEPNKKPRLNPTEEMPTLPVSKRFTLSQNSLVLKQTKSPNVVTQERSALESASNPEATSNVPPENIGSPLKLANKPKLSKMDLQSLEKEKSEIRRVQLEQTKILLEKLDQIKDHIDPNEKNEILEKIKSLSSNVSTSLIKDTNVLQTKKEEKLKQLSSKTIKSEKQKELLDRELDSISSNIQEEPNTVTDIKEEEDQNAVVSVTPALTNDSKVDTTSKESIKTANEIPTQTNENISSPKSLTNPSEVSISSSTNSNNKEIYKLKQKVHSLQNMVTYFLKTQFLKHLFFLRLLLWEFQLHLQEEQFLEEEVLFEVCEQEAVVVELEEILFWIIGLL